MRKPILAAAILAMLPLGACTSDNYGGGYGYDRPSDRRGPPRMRGCSEREARAAAREAGLRDPEVVRVTPGRVVVEGFTRRGPDRITFANERGCPEI